MCAYGAEQECSALFLTIGKTTRYACGVTKSFSKKTSRDKIEKVSPANSKSKEVFYMPVDENSLSHTRWDCKYHIVFSPKFRRKVIYGKLKSDIGQILRELCERKEVEIIEANACSDHVHMLVRIPPKIAVSSFMGYLKGKSTLMIFERHANLKYKYGNRNFWCKGYYVSTVGRNKEAIQRYIKYQQEEDMMADKMTAKEYVDPFKG